MIDEQVGFLLDSLASQGMLDDTVVVFASDHGDCLGDHGHSQKWNMYEEVVRVPAIVWFGSGAMKMVGVEAQPRRVDGLVSLMDLGPTMLDCAGVTPPQEMDAVSLLPLLRGESLLADPADGAADSHSPVAKSDSMWDVAGVGSRFVGPAGRRYVFAEHGRDNILDAVEVMTMVRDERWKLVSFPGQEDGQLYDLVGDPSEEENLFHRAEFAPKREELTAVLADWLQESLYRTRATRRR
jgi:arylsulfatase A-like enzyme